MAHFAKLDTDNKVVRVEVVSNDIATTEQAGVDFLKDLYKDNNARWVQTFDDGTRGNYAGKGYKYNLSEDAFIPPKPFPSWVLNSSFKWEAPIAWPSVDDQGNSLPRDRFYEDNLHIYWDENSSGYLGQRVVDGVTITKEWNSDNSTWSIKE